MDSLSTKANIEALVELYSYKVNDLAQGKYPLGGELSVHKLRRYLMVQKLPGSLRVEFGKADRAFRSLGKKQTQAPLPEQESEPNWTYDAATLIEEASPVAEAEVLRSFQEQVYWYQIELAVAKTVPQLVLGDRAELRLAYCLMLNFNSFQRNFRAGSEFSLVHFKVTHPISPLNDPLSSLTNPAVAQRVLVEFLHLGFQLWRGGKGPQFESGRVIEFLERFLQKIIEDPASISIESSGGQLSTTAIRQAIEEAQSLPPIERAETLRLFQGKLRIAETYERQVNSLIDEERRVYQQAAQRLMARVRAWLPDPVGERPWPELTPKILGGDSPEYRIESMVPGASEVTVKLQPVRLELGGIKIRLQVGGGQARISVDEEQVLLTESGPARITSGAYEILAFRSGEYAHIRLAARQSLDLVGQISLARAAAYLITPSEEFGYIRLMRAITARCRGETNFSAYDAQSALQHGYARAGVEELAAFAGKGFRALWQTFSDEPETFGFIHEVGEAMGMAEKAQTLEELFHDAINRQVKPDGELILEPDGTGRATIGGSRFEFEAGSDATVVASGLETREMKDFLVWPTPDMTIAMAQEGRRIGWIVIGPQVFRSRI